MTELQQESYETKKYIKRQKTITDKFREINQRFTEETGTTVEQKSDLNMIFFYKEELLGIHKTGKSTTDKTVNRTLRRLNLIKFTHNKGYHLTQITIKTLAIKD